MGSEIPNSLTTAKRVASSEDFRGLLSPVLHYLKKMELELTCPDCSELLREPTLLPCNHIFCSHCIRSGDDYRSNCLACPSSFAGGDRRHSIHIEAIVNIFKRLNDATTAIAQKLDSQVDTSGRMVSSHSLGNTGIEAMKVPSNASPVFVSSQSEVPSKDAQVNVSGLKVPPKEITLSDGNGANEDLQGSQFGISEANIPRKESYVSSTTNTKEALQERPASEESEGRQGSKRLSMDTSQKKNMETETDGKRGLLLPCADPCERPSSEKSKHASSFRPSCQRDADNIGLSKRQKLNCTDGSEHDSHVLHASFNLPNRDTEEKINTSSSLINHNFLVDSPIFEQQFRDIWMTSFGASNEWLLCGSDLSPLEEKLLKKFASLTRISVSMKWKRDVTHIIVSTDEHGRCSSSKDVLISILSGKWVLKIDWVKACIEAKRPALEKPYEVSQIKLEGLAGSHGPKKGRLRPMGKAPWVYAGYSFYFCDQFDTVERSYFEELIIAAGGKVVKEDDLSPRLLTRNVSSFVSSYIVYKKDLGKTGTKMRLEASALAGKTGFRVIGHPSLVDTIASWLMTL